MNKKESFGLLINPFTRIAGWEAVFAGLIINFLIVFSGWYGHMIFDGAIDIHLVPTIGFGNALALYGAGLVALLLSMLAASFFTSKSFRFIDVAGTLLLSKTPYLLAALFAHFVTMPDMVNLVRDPSILLKAGSFIILLILILIVTVWHITLMYNAMKVSCGVKGNKFTVVFILALFIAEIVSKTIIYFFIK